MNQQNFNDAQLNRAKLAAVQSLLSNETIIDSNAQDFEIDAMGAADFLKTLATSKDFDTLIQNDFEALLIPLDAMFKTLVTDIKALLTANVVTLNNEFAQL